MARRSTRRPPGRPPLLDEEMHERLITATKNGSPMWAAAEYAGITCRTFERWAARGYEEDTRLHNDSTAVPDETEAPYRQLFLDLQRARADATVRNTTNIQRAAMGGIVTEETTKKYRDPSTGEMVEETTVKRTAPDWRASAWWLERRDAANFGKQADLALEVSGPGGGPMQVAAGSVDDLAEKVRANILALTATAATEDERDSDDVTDAEIVEDD